MGVPPHSSMFLAHALSKRDGVLEVSLCLLMALRASSSVLKGPSWKNRHPTCGEKVL